MKASAAGSLNVGQARQTDLISAVPHRLGSRAVGPLIVAALSVVAVAPQVFPLTALSTLSYDALDANIFLWNFWWTKHALAEMRNPYWTELISYPSGASLAFHSYPLPHSLLALPFQLVLGGTTGLVVAFNVIVLASCIASALGAYCVSLRVTRNEPAAVIAGIIFTCTPYRFLNIARLHVVATEFLAWYVACLVAFTDGPSRGRALGLAACLAGSFYASPEYALYAIGFSAFWLAFSWQSRRALLTKAFWRRLALAAVVFAMLTGPLLYLQTRSAVHGDVAPSRPLEEVAAWSPALLSFVTPSRIHPLYGKALAFAGEYGTPGILGMRSETSIGLTVWLLALIGLRRMRRDRSHFWALATAGFLILTLGPYLRVSGRWMTHIPLPYAALYALVPPWRASRDPTRLFAMTMLLMSVLAAFGVRACLEQMRSGVATAATTAVIASLVMFEGLTIRPAKVRADQLIHPAYGRIAAAIGNSAVMDLGADQTALGAQTWHGKPITAGAISNPRSASAGQMLRVEYDFRRAEAILGLDEPALSSRLVLDRQDLRRLDLRFVVFPEGGAAQRELARRLGLRVSTDRGLTVCEVPLPR